MSEQLHIRDTRNGDWFFVHNALIEKFGKIVGVYGIAVYNVLAMYANNATQEAFPSYATIAKSIGCSRRKVMSTVDLLAEHNIIGKTTRQGANGVYDSNVIILLHKDEWGSAQRSLPEVVNQVHHPPSEQDAPGVVNQVHGGSAPGAPKQDSVNKTHNNKTQEAQPPPNPKKPRKKKETAPKPAAVHVYRSIANRFPDKAIWDTLDQAIGDKQEDLDHFGEVVKWCIGAGWNKLNINGMIDVFNKGDKHGRSPVRKGQPSVNGQTGSGKGSDTEVYKRENASDISARIAELSR